MPRDLLKFLFAESFIPEQDEAIAAVFEDIEEVEELEIKKKPLEAALKELGLKLEIDLGPCGACARLSSEEEYSNAVEVLAKPETVAKLAELGWVANYGGDTETENADEPSFKLIFVDITEVEPQNSDDEPDLERLLKDVDDVEAPKGIGSDLKPGEAPVKGNKPEQGKDPKKAIKEGDDWDEVMGSFQALDMPTQLLLRRVAADYLISRGAGEVGSSDVNHALVSLYHQYGDWNEISDLEF